MLGGLQTAAGATAFAPVEPAAPAGREAWATLKEISLAAWKRFGEVVSATDEAVLGREPTDAEEASWDAAHLADTEAAAAVAAFPIATPQQAREKVAHLQAVGQQPELIMAALLADVARLTETPTSSAAAGPSNSDRARNCPVAPLAHEAAALIAREQAAEDAEIAARKAGDRDREVECDAEASRAINQIEALEDRASRLQATSAEGAVLQLQIAASLGEKILCGLKADYRLSQQEKGERLIKSALKVLAPSPAVALNHEFWVGSYDDEEILPSAVTA
jgi:hypothetical protein